MEQTELSESAAEMLPGVWRAIARMSPHGGILINAYTIVDGDDALMVDTAWWTGVPGTHLDELLAAAHRAGGALRGVFVTHAHRDHSGFAGQVARSTEPPAPVLLHRDELPTVLAMRNYQGIDTRDEAVAWYRGFGFPAQQAADIVDTKYADFPLEDDLIRWCDTDEVIEVGARRLRVVPTPGHTPGHAALWEERTGILFSGDALLPRGSGNPHVTVRPFTSPDPLTDYVSGLEGLRALDARVCLPGHGPAVDEVPELIDAHLSYVQKKVASVDEVLTVRPRTAYEVASMLRWRGGRMAFEDLANDEWFLAFADTLARLRRLVTLGRACEEADDEGIPVFRSAG